MIINKILESTDSSTKLAKEAKEFATTSLDIKPGCKQIPDKLMDVLLDKYNLIIYSSEDAALPMDASFSIEGDNIVFEGGASYNGIGRAVVTVPLDKAGDLYTISLSDEVYDDNKVLNELSNLGWDL
jgi:hypothetical protein